MSVDLSNPGRVKVGPKGRWARIPEGWHQVVEGRCQEGDKFLNLETLWWSLAEKDDIGESVENFDYLIRKDREN